MRWEAQDFWAALFGYLAKVEPGPSGAKGTGRV